MANSNIEWTKKTWNPTTGCTHYSSSKNGGNECLNCYSDPLTNRLKAMGQERYKMGFDVVVEHYDVLDEPYTWKQPSTVFVNSMSDLFHKDISDDFIRKVFKVMNDTPQHKYQILTKRHHRLDTLPDDLIWSDNIWMGVSCGTQYSTKRIPSLVDSKAKHKFLSIEPLIQEINEIDLTGIDWVIVGGESGNNTFKREKDENGEDKFQIIENKVVYTNLLDENGKKIIEKVIRPMKKEWVDKIKDKCAEQNIPFFFKQWGKIKNNPDQNDPSINKQHPYHAKGGCQLDGKYYLANPSVENDSIPIIKIFDEEYFVIDEFEELMTIWELKSYLPIMEDSLYSQLKNDIKRNGLNDPILYFTTPEGKKLVVEGHTRLKACIELKLKEIPIKEVKEDFESLDDIKFWMVKHQIQRRNLTQIEKIELAFKSKETIEKVAKQNLSRAGQKLDVVTPIDTLDEIAKIAGIGRTTIHKYSKIIDKASESIIKQVRSEEISISSAYNNIIDSPVKIIKPKQEKKSVEYNILTSIDEAGQQLTNGTIDGYIVVKNKSQLELFIQKKMDRLGVVILETI
jgi:protein gp37